MNEQSQKSPLLKKISGVWKGINIIRLVILNVVFFVILYYALSWLMSDNRPVVPDSTMLVINPYGTVVDELRFPELMDPVKRMVGMGPGYESLLKDLVDAINAGKDDDRVKGLYLSLNGLGGIGLSKLQDLGAAIEGFKKSGKKVIAMADIYTRNRYYLAAYADEIHMHNMGYILMQGYGRFRRFYKEALDKFGIDVNVFKVGTYKSAVEPYLRQNMSEADKEASTRWMGAMWNAYLKDVSTARGISVDAINNYADNIPQRLKEAKGNAGEAAKNAGLIDHLTTRDQIRKRLIDITGENEDTHSYYGIGYKSYLAALSRDRWGDYASGDLVGVVVAKGGIVDGYQPPGEIGGESTARLIRRARQDERVKVILLKVDSGGGSTFASEIIRRELGAGTGRREKSCCFHGQCCCFRWILDQPCFR